jgi:hypothetical protein
VTLINGMRLTEPMVEHGTGLRASRVVEFKRFDESIFSQEDGLALWAYRSVRSRSTDFGQVGFEPGQVPTALKPAFYLDF